MISLILVAMAISSAYAASWCKYDCGSYFPNHMGFNNYASNNAFLPFHRTTGLSPFSAQQLCSTPTTLSELTHPVEMIFGGKTVFAVLCGEGVNVFEIIETGFSKIGEIPLSSDNPGFYLTSDFNRLVLSTENKATLYEVSEEGISVVAEVESDSSSSAASHVAGNSIYGYFGSKVLIMDMNKGTFTEIDTEETNSLGYAVIDGSGNAYFCSTNGVVQANLNAQNSKVIQIDGECSALLANREGHLIVTTTNSEAKTSSLFEVNTATGTYKRFADYDFAISGMSRVAWTSGKSRVALLSFHSNLGVHVVFERHPRFAEGTVRSFFNTTASLTGKPTFTSLGNPIVFGAEEAFAYTDEFLVRIYSTKFLKPLDHYTAFDFLPNPLYFGRQILVGVTTDGFAVAYNRCERYPIGSERPENSCPFADLEPEPEEATWLQIGVGAGAFVAFPLLGTTLCKKMKLLGDEEDDHVDVELYSESEDDDEEEEERYLTPTPINVK